MEIKLIKVNEYLIKNIFLFFYLLKVSFCFIQQIKKSKNREYYNYLSLKKELFHKASEYTKIFGNINELNYYYINLYLGKDKKKQSFLLDTGSGVTSIPCKPYCNQCGQHMNSYLYVNDKQIIECNNEKCSSVESECNEENNHCSFKVHYEENSYIKGIYFNELIQFSKDNDIYKNNFSNLIPIGCTTYEDNLFYTQKVDGIIGLSNSGKNLINILYKYKIINNNIFSLCLAQKGGYITIDEIEKKYHKEEIKYINIDKDIYYYSFTINKIKINNNTISNDIYPAKIDSGSTLTNIPIKFANYIINYINDLCNLDKNKKLCGEYFINKELDSCYKFNSSSQFDYVLNNIWPNITFSINDYDYIWNPSQYLMKFIENNKIIGCFGFIKNRANSFTLGASWMIGHDIIFDNNNNKIGFAEADCNQGDITNNGEEDEEIPLYNDNINISENNLGKKMFIIYITIIILLIICIIFSFICICFLNKKRRFIHSKRKNIEDEFLKNFFSKNNVGEINKDIKQKNDKISPFVEMNNTYSI